VDELLEFGSLAAARTKARSVSRQGLLVRDGDVLEIRFNV